MGENEYKMCDVQKGINMKDKWMSNMQWNLEIYLSSS